MDIKLIRAGDVEVGMYVQGHSGSCWYPVQSIEVGVEGLGVTYKRALLFRLGRAENVVMQCTEGYLLVGVRKGG